MAQGYSQRKTQYDEVEPSPDAPSPIVVVTPGAIVRGPDGKMTWVARCPRCSDRNDESVVASNDGSSRAQCQTCGAIVEVRESGIYRASSTIPPPEE